MKQHSAFLILGLFVGLQFGFASAGFAWGDSGDGGGCCQDITESVLSREPAMVQARGLDLFEKLKREPHSRLVLLEALDESVCLELREDCRDLEPAIVQRLVKIARETQRQESENSWQSWNYAIGAFNALLALAAFITSVFAYRASRK